MINPGFELTAPGTYTAATAISGWTVESSINNGSCTASGWTPGSPEVTVRTTPFTSYPFPGAPNGIINHSPLGGANVLQIGDTTTNLLTTRLRQNFVVTYSNTLLQIAYAGYWQYAHGHNCCQSPAYMIRLYDCQGTLQMCTNLSMAVGTGCVGNGVTYSVSSNGDFWHNWQIKDIDLSLFAGTCVTLEVIVKDCSNGCHFGSALFDFGTTSALTITPPGYTLFLPPQTPVYCPNSGSAQVIAPPGYVYYQWTGPYGAIPPPHGTMQILHVSPATAYAVYSVVATTFNGCQYLKTYTLNPTTVSINGLAVNGSCPGGTAGSATVIAGGSSAGYTYTWTNSTNSIVSTGSVASGLAPGNYTVTVSGSTLAPCGTASTVVTIPANTANLLPASFQPFCSLAYLKAPPNGTNYKWYTNNSLVIGATQASHTVTSPCNACTYTVAYDNSNGCRDSMVIHTFSATPGSVVTPSANIVPACLNTPNGQALIRVFPTQSAPGPISYSIICTGTTPAYSLISTLSSSVLLSNIYAGNYSITVFDGACHYSNVWQIPTAVTGFSLSRPEATICAGNSLQIYPHIEGGQNFSLFTYNWSPATWLTNNSPVSPGRTIIPAPLPQGSIAVTVYSVTITSIKNSSCSITKTLAITAANPISPTIAAIPSICNNGSQYTIQTQPPGGVFSTITGNKNIIDPVSGIVNAKGAASGPYTIKYTVYTAGCSAFTTTSTYVHHFNSAALTTDSAFLCSASYNKYLHWYCKETIAGIWSGPHVQHPDFLTPNATPGYYHLYYKTVSSPDPKLCPDSSSLVVNVVAPPIVTVPSFTICEGHPVVLSPAGALSYSYYPGKGYKPPVGVTSYSVWGIDKHGCRSLSPAVASVSILPLPLLTITASDSLPCAGDEVTLKVYGADEMQWLNGPPDSVWVIYPLAPSTYTASGALNGCHSTRTFFLNTAECLSLSEKDPGGWRVYPNPFINSLSIFNPEQHTVHGSISDVTGRAVQKLSLAPGTNMLDVSELLPGLYFFHTGDLHNHQTAVPLIRTD